MDRLERISGRDHPRTLRFEIEGHSDRSHVGATVGAQRRQGAQVAFAPELQEQWREVVPARYPRRHATIFPSGPVPLRGAVRDRRQRTRSPARQRMTHGSTRALLRAPAVTWQPRAVAHVPQPEPDEGDVGGAGVDPAVPRGWVEREASPHDREGRGDHQGCRDGLGRPGRQRIASPAGQDREQQQDRDEKGHREGQEGGCPE